VKKFSIDDAVIEVAPAEEFQISARAVPTGGFRWLWECDDSSVEEVSQEFEPHSRAVGGATQQHFVFRATASGVFALRLRYQQAGAASPREVHAFEVRVSGEDR